MSIALLAQVYDETRRLAIAGSVVAPGDFRIKKLIAPLETQVREHHLQLRRRLESIRRIHQASDELEERIAELEQARDLLLIQQDGLSGQIEAIDDIVEMPDAWPMAANSAAA